MPSLLPGYEYDIFISYRQNDNRSGWVTQFVTALQEELASTIKEPIAIYFDSNPHDGLLETHSVDKSLEGKLKCLIFIPIISQTYCDPKAFAWQHELCAFNDLSKADRFGRDIKLASGNVSSRILPVKIHDLDEEDKALLERELGGVLRAVDFIFKSTGVNRSLRATEDHPQDNVNKTFYRDQVNKVANAVKEIIGGLKKFETGQVKTALKNPQSSNWTGPGPKPRTQRLFASSSLVLLLLLLAGYFIFNFTSLRDKFMNQPLSKSIAVLPFVNMSNDPEQEYFSDGITDEILNRLYKLGDLKVISRTSSMTFKGAKLTAKEIANRLGVANILEGSVQKAGSRIKITVQLIDALSDNHLWSETYEREFKDIFSIQSEIASGVARELRVKLSPQVTNSFGEVPTQNQLAYEYNLKGDDYFSRYDVDNAIKLYTKSIEEDSLYAQPYFARANAHLFIFWVKRGEEWENHLHPAEQDIHFLQAKYPASAECKKAMALYDYWVKRKYQEALTSFNEVAAQNPNDDGVHVWIYSILKRLGRWKEATEEGERTIHADPMNADYRFQLVMGYKLLHQPGKALLNAQSGLSNNPELQFLKALIFFSYIDLGHDVPESLKESGLSKDELVNMTGGFDFIDKTTAILDKQRKDGKLIESDQHTYEPLDLKYALLYYLNGNRTVAKVYADSATTVLLARQPKMVNDYRLYAALGKCYAISGHESLAFNNGNKAIQLLPVSLDAWDGTTYEQNMAEIYIILKKYDLALDKIEMLLSIPSQLSVGWMMVDSQYEPLRGLPRFKKLAEKYGPKP